MQAKAVISRSVVGRQEKLSVAPASCRLSRGRPALATESRHGRRYEILTALVANAVVTDCAGLRCRRERSSSPSICNPSRSCA